jgi:hypothetical protein
VAFGAELKQQFYEPELFSEFEFRLPTEAEWGVRLPGGQQSTILLRADEDRLGDYAWYGRTVTAKPIPSARRNRTRGACMTCMAMCGSGARIGTDHIRKGRSLIRLGLRTEMRACCGAGRTPMGFLSPCPVGLAAAARPPVVTTALGFGWCVFARRLCSVISFFQIRCQKSFLGGANLPVCRDDQQVVAHQSEMTFAA